MQCQLTTRTPRSLATGTSVLISGIWQPAPPGKEQAYELKANEVKIIGSADAEVSATILSLRKARALVNSCFMLQENPR